MEPFCAGQMPAFFMADGRSVSTIAFRTDHT